MRLTRSHFNAVAVIPLLLAVLMPLSDPAFAEPDDSKLANNRCLMCHGREGFSREGPDGLFYSLLEKSG